MTVREKFESHRGGMVTLGKNEPDLESSIPKAGANAAAVSGSSVRFLYKIEQCRFSHFHNVFLLIDLGCWMKC